MSAEPVGTPPFWVWMGSQHLNTDSVRSRAAIEIQRRWGLWEGYSHAKVLRILAREGSEHLRGGQALADDYANLFEIAKEKQVTAFGALSPLLPVEAMQCNYILKNDRRCSKESIPGATMCGRHGGSWVNEEERRAIVAAITERLVTTADRAVGVLIDAMDNARSEKVRTDVALAILDRIGVGPTSKLDISVSAGAAAAADEVRARLQHLSAEMVTSYGDAAAEDIVEGELVGEPETV